MSEQQSSADSAQPAEAHMMIRARIRDLRDANDIYRKDSRDRSADIQRNDREIRWLTDIRSVLVAPQPARTEPQTAPACIHKTCDDPEWCTGEPACRYTEPQPSGMREALEKIAKQATSTEMREAIAKECAEFESARSWHASAGLADFEGGYDECVRVAREALRSQAVIAPQAAIENLTNHQVQCDQDGVMIQVSRQALDEVLSYVALTRPERS